MGEEEKVVEEQKVVEEEGVAKKEAEKVEEEVAEEGSGREKVVAVGRIISEG